jgi:hypothetical protein
LIEATLCHFHFSFFLPSIFFENFDVVQELEAFGFDAFVLLLQDLYVSLCIPLAESIYVETRKHAK